MQDTIASWLRTLRIIARNLRNRKYEREIPFMRHFLRPGDTCLHIGASDGRHTVVMARLVRPGRVHCFEPSRYTLDILGRALWFHGIDNVSCQALAVGAEPGQLQLVTPVKANGHLGRSFAYLSSSGPDRELLQRTRNFHDVRVEPVTVCTVDDYCASQGIDAVQFIRCDIEGAEIWMLRGAAQVLQRDRPILLLEVHPQALRNHFGSSADEVRALLAGQGYRFYHVEGEGLREVDAFIEEPWRDYFCVPAERVVDFTVLPAGASSAMRSKVLDEVRAMSR